MVLRKKKNGFALLEVVIAFSIILIIIVPLIGMTSAVVKMGTSQKKENTTGNIENKIIDSNYSSKESIVNNLLKNIKSLGYEGLSPLISKSSNFSPIIYECLLVLDNSSNPNSSGNSIGNYYYLTPKLFSNSTLNKIIYNNIDKNSSMPTIYLTDRDNLSGKSVNITISRGIMTNMPFVETIWNQSSRAGNYNIAGNQLNTENIAIDAIPSFILVEVELENIKKSILLSPLENYYSDKL